MNAHLIDPLISAKAALASALFDLGVREDIGEADTSDLTVHVEELLDQIYAYQRALLAGRCAERAASHLGRHRALEGVR